MNDHNKINVNEYIKLNAGVECLRVCKEFESDVILLKNTQESLFFNKKCLEYDVTPKWTLCKSRINTPAGHRIAKRFSINNLKLQIKLDNNKLSRLNKSIDYKLTIIVQKLPQHIVDIIRTRTDIKSNYIRSKRRHVLDKKFKKLYQVKNDRMIGMNNFIPNDKNTVKLNNEWTVNLSSRKFDKFEISVFNLDPKFQVTPCIMKSEQIIANIESKLKFIIQDKSKLAKTRISLINAINSFEKAKPNLSTEQLKAIKRIKCYKDIFITQADKGNKTVILNYQDYLNKIYEILQDRQSYAIVKTDKTKSKANKLIDKLKTYHKQGLLEYNQYLKFYPDNYNLPDIYALIKIHKINNPARLICPYFCHPLSNLSSYISDVITPSIRNSPYSISNKFKFVEEIKKKKKKNLRITRNDIMISLDIVNLFTNIPLDYTMNIVHEKLCNDDQLGERTKLPVSEIMNLIIFIMQSNYFTFNKAIYQQISGAPMGCNLSPILAEALVSTIFELALINDDHVKFCRFYVDDSFLIIHKRYVD